MSHRIRFTTPTVLAALVLVVLSGVLLLSSDNAAHAQSSPSVAVSLSDASVEQGTAITATMSFRGLTFDSDTSTTDYAFRADVTGANNCEGSGLGRTRYMYKVDEDPEVRSGTVSASCPAGDYTIRATISTPQSVALAAATASFTVAAPAQEPTASPTASIALSPSDAVGEGAEITATMSFGGLASDSDTSTTDYVFRADVVDADDCEGGGIGFDRYMYRVDEDPETRTGTISAGCPAGAYTLRVSISSSDNTELASATAGFFILGAPVLIEPPTLTALSVSHGDPAVDVTLSPAFESGTLAYRAAVKVAQVTVAPTASDADATVAYLDGNGDAIADADAGADGHQVDLEAGSNTVKVAVSKDSLTTTYTVKLLRLVTQQQTADATGEPTISGTNLVGQTLTANKGTIADTDGLPLESTFTYQWIRVSSGSEADISGATSKTYTTVSADQGKKLKVKVGFTDNASNDESRTSLASEIIGATSCTPSAPAAAIWSACLTVDQSGYYFTFPGADDNFGALSNPEVTVGGNTYTINDFERFGSSLFLAFTSAPGNAASGWVLYIGSASTSFALSAATTSSAGKVYNWTNTSLTWSGGDVISVWIAPALSSDATLSALALSGVDALAPPFRWDFTGYRATVDNPVSSIVVTATPNHPGASAEVLADNLPADSNGRVSLGWGDNTVKVVVTAEDGTATKTYQVIVHRRYPAGRAGPHIVVAASKQVSDRKGGPDNGGYRERDLIIALYNLESDATWSGYNYSGDFSTLDYVHRTDILDSSGTTALADLERRNECEGPAYSERNHIQMSVDRQIRKVNENPETRGGGVIDAGDCVNAFKVTVTVWTGAAYDSQGRGAAPVAQLTCQFDGLDSTHDDFRALPWGGEHEGPGWYYHEYVLCTDANGDLAPDSTPTIPALNWEPPEYD